ncbi:MAG: hypothetical protein ACJ78U_19720 [Myxococcales bacterium]
MKKLLLPLLCALLATPALASETRNQKDHSDAFRDVVGVETHRNPAAVIATDAIYGGIAGLAIGAGVALIEQDHNWGRDLSLGAGVGLLVGAAFGAIDAVSADRTMSAADLLARNELRSSQKHPAMLGYQIGF